MPVDPDIRKILEQTLPLLPQNWEEVDPVEFRKESKAYNKFLKVDVPVSKTEDFEIPAEGGKLNARLYSNGDEKAPMVLYFHGGGFVFGDIDSLDSVCRIVSRVAHVSVVSVEYRLAPEHKFPTAVEDAYASYLWLLEHSEKFNIEAGKIAVMGDSAGANLCAALSVKCIEEGKQLPALSVQFYPVVAPDFSSHSAREYSEGFALSDDMIRWFHRLYSSGEDDMMSPLRFPMLYSRLSEMPSTIVVTAEYDVLRDQGEAFVAKLRKNSVEATGIRGLGLIHGFLGYIKYSRAAMDVLNMVAALVMERLADQ